MQNRIARIMEQCTPLDKTAIHIGMWKNCVGKTIGLKRARPTGAASSEAGKICMREKLSHMPRNRRPQACIYTSRGSVRGIPQPCSRATNLKVYLSLLPSALSRFLSRAAYASRCFADDDMPPRRRGQPLGVTGFRGVRWRP
jgi:hypothetical protein